MTIRRTPRFWTHTCVAALAVGTLVACDNQENGKTGDSAPATENAAPETTAPEASAPEAATEAPAEPYYAGSGGETGGESGGESGGEAGGEGGEAGGEGGIDPQAAAKNPVVYSTALEVMRAHYIAGLAALEAGDKEAGAEMFAHPISEIYIDLEPVIAEQDGPEMSEKLNNAVGLFYSEEASNEDIKEAGNEILALLDQSLEVAPEQPGLSDAATHAGVLADMIDRAAMQYAFAEGQDAEGEAWLDGYGLQRAASGYAEKNLAVVAEADQEAADRFSEALALLETAFAEYERPETFEPSPQDVLGASISAKSASQRLYVGQ
ncbi:hypothetical protein ACSHT0_04235 [Tepidicaulis sp. LMO-SS28]|uniref:hypothetical protein n=1 Tax=Tepidicaulis sp. LMO-SS28 TaxID=3447455 RepID=UPI003EDF3168